MPGHDPALELRQERIARVGAAEGRPRELGSGVEGRRVGERVAVVAAVRGVQVHEDVRIPRDEHGQRRPRLRRIGLDVIPIEVETLGVGALSDHFRPVL